jgi:hypothetical protein
MLLAMTFASATTLMQPAPAQAAESAAVGTCKVGCERTLASCEDKQGTKAQCPRRYQACIEACETPPKAEKRTKKQLRRARCEQRCDMNRVTCGDANPGDPAMCAAGRQSCVERC